MELSEQRLLLSKVAALEAENRELKTAIHNLRVDFAHEERERRMLAAGLSETSKDRLRKAFEYSTDNAGLKQAINTEKKVTQ